MKHAKQVEELAVAEEIIEKPITPPVIDVIKDELKLENGEVSNQNNFA